MKTFTCIALACFTGAWLASAGPETLVKERAKDLRDQHNANQGGPGQPTAPPAAPSTPAPAVRPAAGGKTKPSPVAKIRTDLAAWQNSKAVTDDAKKEFAADVLAAVRGSKSPASAKLDQFTARLATAVSGRTLGGGELSRLADNINLAVNSASLSDERTDEIAAQVQADLEKSGVDATAATGVAESLKELMAGLKE